MVQEKNIVRLGLTIILFIALLGLVSTPALAKGKGRHVKKACSQSASAAFLACYNEKKDDYWIAQGNCYNLSEPEDRAGCFEDAKTEYNEAKAECGDQLEARKDVCDELGEAPYDPPIEEFEWVNINAGNANPYFPLVPGTKWLYKTKVGEDVTETILVEVTDETVVIEGVECVVVHDVVYEGNNTDDENIIEDTYDWYAQDVDGNVWYFGERTLAREDCEEEDCDVFLLVNDGSWIAGVEDAKPGIVMFADPSAEIGTVYRQEFFLGDAEDVAEVLSIGDAVVEVPYDTFRRRVLKTRDFTPIEPDVEEFKYYAPRVGVVLEENPGASERVELVRFAPGS